MPGNTSDKTTLKLFLKKIQAQYGQAKRIWIMDRGIPTEETLQDRRQSDPPVSYLVGTPHARWDHLKDEFEKVPWQELRDAVEVRLLAQGGEVYVLARSQGRRAKEIAIRRRKLAKLLRSLRALRRTAPGNAPGNTTYCGTRSRTERWRTILHPSRRSPATKSSLAAEALPLWLFLESLQGAFLPRLQQLRDQSVSGWCEAHPACPGCVGGNTQSARMGASCRSADYPPAGGSLSSECIRHAILHQRLVDRGLDLEGQAVDGLEHGDLAQPESPFTTPARPLATKNGAIVVAVSRKIYQPAGIAPVCV